MEFESDGLKCFVSSLRSSLLFRFCSSQRMCSLTETVLLQHCIGFAVLKSTN